MCAVRMIHFVSSREQGLIVFLEIACGCSEIGYREHFGSGFVRIVVEAWTRAGHRHLYIK